MESPPGALHPGSPLVGAVLEPVGSAVPGVFPLPKQLRGGGEQVGAQAPYGTMAGAMPPSLGAPLAYPSVV